MRQEADVHDEFPAESERQAGMTAGETTDPAEATADDLAPETLLDEERSYSPAAQQKRVPRDTELRDAGVPEPIESGSLDEAGLVPLTTRRVREQERADNAPARRRDTR